MISGEIKAETLTSVPNHLLRQHRHRHQHVQYTRHFIRALTHTCTRTVLFVHTSWALSPPGVTASTARASSKKGMASSHSSRSIYTPGGEGEEREGWDEKGRGKEEKEVGMRGG